MSSCRRWCSWPTRSRIGSGLGGHRTSIRWSCPRMARNVSKPTAEDSRARFAARELRMWRARGSAMLQLPGSVARRHGRAVRSGRSRGVTEQMKPKKGEPWAPFEQRAADALVALCDPAPRRRRHADVGAAGGDPGGGAVARSGGDRRGPDRGFVCWSSCGRTRRSRRCSSTTTVRCWRSGGPRRRSRRSCAGRCCCATRGVGSRGVLGGAGCRSTIWCPGVGTAPTRSRTWPASAPHTIDC